MFLVAAIGTATALLEQVATSIGFGLVVVGFVMSAQGMLLRWTREEVDAEAPRVAFQGGMLGTCCLIIDLIVRFLA